MRRVTVDLRVRWMRADMVRRYARRGRSLLVLGHEGCLRSLQLQLPCDGALAAPATMGRWLIIASRDAVNCLCRLLASVSLS